MQRGEGRMEKGGGREREWGKGRGEEGNGKGDERGKRKKGDEVQEELRGREERDKKRKKKVGIREEKEKKGGVREWRISEEGEGRIREGREGEGVKARHGSVTNSCACCLGETITCEFNLVTKLPPVLLLHAENQGDHLQEHPRQLLQWFRVYIDREFESETATASAPSTFI